MGACKYCLNDAGFLRSVHRECESAHLSAKIEIVELVTKIGTNLDKAKYIVKAIRKLADSSYIGPTTLEKLLLKGWEKVVYKTLENPVESIDELDSLEKLAHMLKLPDSAIVNSKATLKIKGIWDAIQREIILDTLSEGTLPPEHLDRFQLPFNLHVSETLIWLFLNVSCFQWGMTKRATIDGWGTIREAKFGWVSGGVGILGITSRHIYFHGRAAFRHSYRDVLTFDYGNYGVVLNFDPFTSFPSMRYSTDDNEYAYLLVKHLAAMN